MSSLVQEHLDQIRLLEQERRRLINEEAELARRSVELSIQRCQTELGITDAFIASAIAREVLGVEQEERQQMAAVRILWREHRRLMQTGGQPIPSQPVNAARRIQDKRRELSRAQVLLDQGRQERRETLHRFINISRVEFLRVHGRQRAIKFATGLARERAANPNVRGVGHLVPWDGGFIRVGEADDYLTIHNPAYPRSPVARDLAPNFRSIKAKGSNIAIRALKSSHGQAYAEMMGDPKELSCSRHEPGLFRSDPTVKKQPVTARIRDLAGDAGHGRGYALAVQGHGDDGPFHGIASYNKILDLSPNEFFGSNNLGNEPCRMVDFNFQLMSGKLPMEMEVEVGTLLIEVARFSFGARLFRSECSPLNTRYIDIMAALGLSKFQALEPASYNPNLAASTWKFDLRAWKATELELQFQRRWFVTKHTMQEDPEAAKRMHEDYDEPPPSLANVQVEPTIFEDPAAFEPMEQPAQSASQSHFGPVQWPQRSESIGWSSSGSYLTGSTPTNDSGTSSGLGYSDSAPSRSTSSTIHDLSHTGSSSGSSASRPLEASGALKVGDEQAPPKEKLDKILVWQGSAAMKALRDQEASRAMPPPKLPKRLTLPSQQSASSGPSATADYSDTASASMEIDSQPSTSYDLKGKRPAYASSIGQPGPSTEAELPAQVSYDQERDQSASEAWSDSEPWPTPEPWPASEPMTNPNDPDMEAASQALVPYDRKGKRPAPMSWDMQPKRPSPLHQSSTPDGTVTDNVQLSSSSVNHQTPPQPSNAAPDDTSPQRARSNWPDPSRQFPTPNPAVHQSTNTELTHISPSVSHSQPASHSPQSPATWQESPLSSQNGDSALSTHSFSQDLRQSHTAEVDTSNVSPAWAPSADQRRPLGASNGLAVYDQLSTHVVQVPRSTTTPNSSGSYTDRYKDRTQSQTETLSVSSESFTTFPRRPASDTTAPQVESSQVHREAPPQAAATYSQVREEYVSETVPYIPRFAVESQQQRRPVQATSPATGFEHAQQQQTAHARIMRPSIQPNQVSQYFMRRPRPEHYNLALYNYVEFVEERPSGQVRSSRTQAALPAEPGDASSTNRRQVGQRNAGARGPARGVTKPQQKGSNGGRQSALGSCPPNEKKNATNTKKATDSQQKTTPVAPNNSLGQTGPSSSVTLQSSPNSLQGRKESPAFKPTPTSLTTVTQRTTRLDTLLSSIALTPESQATSMSNRPLRSSAPSSTHPTGDDQPSIGNARRRRTYWEMPPQQAVPQQVVPQQVVAQPVAPQQASPHQQAVPQQVAPQPATLPQATCRLESQTKDKSKRRPWQL